MKKKEHAGMHVSESYMGSAWNTCPELSSLPITPLRSPSETRAQSRPVSPLLHSGHHLKHVPRAVQSPHHSIQVTIWNTCPEPSSLPITPFKSPSLTYTFALMSLLSYTLSLKMQIVAKVAFQISSVSTFLQRILCWLLIIHVIKIQTLH